MSLGVSIVVCCHNSAKRLPDTLAHLASQKIPDGVSCEVVVVDNASTDNTAVLAQELWPAHCRIPLRVLQEPQLGLSCARHRGIVEAKYEFVSLIDDDNWACPEWVSVAAEIMAQHPEVGACGGYNEAVYEVAPPAWFDQFKASYAVGAQGQGPGDITDTRGFLWGAGLTIRKSAWQQLVDSGYQSLLVDRQGEKLSAGQDTELCFALRLAGWRLWYDPRLRLFHYLPAGRLKWRYLRLLCRGFGEASVSFDSYEIAFNSNGAHSGLVKRVKTTWLWRTLATTKSLLRHPVKLALSLRMPLESDPDVLLIENYWGRLRELFRRRKTYGSNIREINAAPWRRSGVSDSELITQLRTG
jgi:glycosyltransferase involved in cell wall biosynthesis